MKIDFKILSGYFIKILFENYFHGNFKFFSYSYSPITLDIQLGNKYFWKFSKKIIHSLR